MISIDFLDGTTIDIESSVLALFHSYEQTSPWNKEAGGVLIAKQQKNQSHYILTAASSPTKWDKRGRYSFVRSIKSAQPFINERWTISGGIENYIGEWHTHPERYPSPSQTDKALISQVILDNSSPYSKVLLIIVGQQDTLYIGLADIQHPKQTMLYKKIEVDYDNIRIKNQD